MLKFKIEYQKWSYHLPKWGHPLSIHFEMYARFHVFITVWTFPWKLSFYSSTEKGSNPTGPWPFLLTVYKTHQPSLYNSFYNEQKGNSVATYNFLLLYRCFTRSAQIRHYSLKKNRFQKTRRVRYSAVEVKILGNKMDQLVNLGRLLQMLGCIPDIKFMNLSFWDVVFRYRS